MVWRGTGGSAGRRWNGRDRSLVGLDVPVTAARGRVDSRAVNIRQE